MENRTKYKNELNKKKYDRINFMAPKGTKDLAKKAAAEVGASVNEYIYMLIKNDTAAGTSRLAEKKKEFTQEQYSLLEKWQVSKKYYEMIESLSYSKEEGYFIMLKKGYINEVSGSRVIQATKTAEVRNIINKSRKI